MTVGFGLAFLISTIGIGLFSIFTSSSQTQETTQTATLSVEEQLKEQIGNYQLVLEREPNSLFALQNLIAARLQLQSLYARELQQEPDNQVALENFKLINRELAESYQNVLAKDPNNTFALEGLLRLRIQLRDSQGAIELLEKLVKLYPDLDRYQQTLEIVKQQVAAEKEGKSEKTNKGSQ